MLRRSPSPRTQDHTRHLVYFRRAVRRGRVARSTRQREYGSSIMAHRNHPADWVLDPTDPTGGRRRYWDGEVWTDYVLYGASQTEPLVLTVAEAQRATPGAPAVLTPPVRQPYQPGYLERLVLGKLVGFLTLGAIAGVIGFIMWIVGLLSG